MARLGELLVAAGRITPAQLDDGLRAQILYGGRLGTNLVELFHLDLDAIALGLARQHGVPAALGKHFERCDVTVQARLPPVVAERWSAVPIGRLAHRRERIAIASLDPLPPDARDDLAVFLQCAPGDLIVSIAAELRIRYYLERAYGIARPSRYLRVRRQTQHAMPAPEELHEDPTVDVDLDDAPRGADETGTLVAITDLPASTAGLRAGTGARHGDDDEPTLARDFAASRVLDDTPEPPEIEIDPEVAQVLVNEKRRRFVRTLSDVVEDVSEPAPAGEPTPPPPTLAATPPPEGTLARIAIRRVRHEPGRRDDAEPELGRLDEAARAIRRAPTRERVGDLVVRAARTLGGDAVDAVILFAVREPIAIAWKGEVAGDTPPLDRIAVPLDEPNAIARAFEGGHACLDVAGGAATELDRRLWTALGGPEPTQVSVSPVVIGGHPVCLLYAHGRDLLGVDDALRGLAEAASTAFVRLLRQTLR